MTSKTQTKTETKKEKMNLENELKWDSDIKMDSVKKVLDAGIILPEFKPYANSVYEISFKTIPKYVETPKGNFWSIQIDKDGMDYQMKMNASLKFGLKVLMERAKIKEIKDILGIPFKICKNSDGFFSIQTL